MGAAISAIANGGVYVEPTLIDSYVDGDGDVTAADPPPEHRVVSAKAAHEVARMMEAVVGKDGLAPMANINGYRVAGKTGTAQAVDPELRLLQRSQGRVVRRLRTGRCPAVHGVRRGEGPARQRWRWFDRWTGLPRSDGRGPAEVRCSADRCPRTRVPGLLVAADSLDDVARFGVGGEYSTDDGRPDRAGERSRDSSVRYERRRTRARCEGVEVTGLSLSSGGVRAGDLYAALAGARTHGARFAAEAVAAGAVAVLTDAVGAELCADVSVPVLVTRVPACPCSVSWRRSSTADPPKR